MVRTFNSEEAHGYVMSHPELAEIAQQIPFLDFPMVTSRIYSVWNYFRRKRIDIAKPCSGTDEAGCWLLDDLTLFNRMLQRVDVRFYERKPGELILTSSCSSDETSTETDMLDTFFLVCWLMKQHPCIQVIDIKEPRLFLRFPTALKHALAYASNIKSIKTGAALCSNVFLEGMSQCTTLEHLDMCGLRLDAECASQLSELIKRSSLLKSIVLYCCEMNRKCMKQLLKALQQCKNLAFLEMREPVLKEEAAEHVADIIKHSKHLKAIVLDHLRGSALKIIVNALGDNTSIENVKICVADEVSSVMPCLVDVLKRNKTIKALEISDSAIEDGDADFLCQALRVGNSLQKLNCMGNLITDAGAKDIAKALETNLTLLDLDLAWNKLSAVSLVYFVKMLAVNSTLQIVHLGGIDVEDFDEAELVRLLEEHKCCHRISTPWNPAQIDEIGHVISCNRSDVRKVYISSMQGAPVSPVMSALELNHYVTELHIGDTDMHVTVEALSQLLKNTTSLKLLHCTCHLEYNAFTTLIEGLTGNRTVGCVELSGAFFCTGSVKAFVQMLEMNTTLFTFNIGIAYCSKEGLKRIAKHFPVSFTLTDFCSFGEGLHDCRRQDLDAILGVLQRNQQVLNRATRFVLGTCRDSDCRESFHMLWNCDSVANHVKSVIDCTEDDARQRVEAAKLLFL